MKKILGISTFLVVLAASQVANAGTISYSLTSDHCTGTCGTGPFGTVTLDDFNSTGDVQVTVTLNGNGFVETGFDGSFGFNLIGDPTISVTPPSGWSLLSTTAGDPNAHPPQYSFDGFGQFNYVLVCDSCNGGSNPYYGTLTFDVIAAGLNIGSFAELSSIPPGDTQAYFVADIIGTNGNTGPVGATGVPDGGSTVTLLGSVLLGIGMLRRRFSKS